MIHTVLLICICAILTVSANKRGIIDGSQRSSSLFMSLLESDPPCTNLNANTWLKDNLNQLFAAIVDDLIVSDKKIEFPPELKLITGKIDFVDLKLKNLQNIQVKDTKVTFSTSNTQIDIELEAIDLDLEGKYVAELKLFGKDMDNSQKDITTKLQISNFKSTFNLNYQGYPLEMRIDTSDITFDDPEVDVVMENIVTSETCINNVVNTEISQSVMNYIKYEKDVFVETVNSQLEVIVKKLLDQWLPDKKPEVPLPGPSGGGGGGGGSRIKPDPKENNGPDIIKESFSEIVSQKVQEEFAKFVNHDQVQDS